MQELSNKIEEAVETYLEEVPRAATPEIAKEVADLVTEELNKKGKKFLEPKEEQTFSQIMIEQLPLPVLRERLDAKGIVYKSTDKKKELIKALLSGESTIKKPEKKAAPKMADKVQPKPAALISNEVLTKLKELEAQGLKWEVDEEFSCINFFGKIPTCANLDQSPNNIIRTANEALAKGSKAPPEVNHTKDLY